METVRTVVGDKPSVYAMAPGYESDASDDYHLDAEFDTYRIPIRYRRAPHPRRIRKRRRRNIFTWLYDWLEDVSHFYLPVLAIAALLGIVVLLAQDDRTFTSGDVTRLLIATIGLVLFFVPIAAVGLFCSVVRPRRKYGVRAKQTELRYFWTLYFIVSLFILTVGSKAVNVSNASTISLLIGAFMILYSLFSICNVR